MNFDLIDTNLYYLLPGMAVAIPGIALVVYGIFTLFKRTNVKQKLNICEMIIDRISSGEKMDLNIVDVMARDAGVDITSISESTRKHKEMLAKK